jgi:SET domain-containing protein
VRAGNVARFMNHRCDSGNAFARGVVVEGNSGLIYKVAFFARRDIDALEELTYNYHWEADDASADTAQAHAFSPGAHFRACKCGSANCVKIFKF